MTHSVAGIPGPRPIAAAALCFVAVLPVTATMEPRARADRTAVSAPIAGTSQRPEPPPLQLRLFVHRLVPFTDHQFEWMREEVDRLWAPYGVQLSWNPRTPPYEGRTDDALRLVLVRDAVWKAEEGDNGGDNFTMAALHRGTRGFPRTVVLASRARVEDMVDLALKRAGVGRGMAADRLTMLMLGRVIAHEIGHYLLGSSHTASGLMRATFAPEDVVRSDGYRFSLPTGAREAVDAFAASLAATAAADAGASGPATVLLAKSIF